MSKGNAITIQRGRKGGAYDDILTVAQSIERDYGSATNAIAVMVRQSPLYQEAAAKLAKTKRKQTHDVTT